MGTIVRKNQTILKKKYRLLAVLCSLGMVLAGVVKNERTLHAEPTATNTESDAPIKLDANAKKRQAVAEAAKSHINSVKWSFHMPRPGLYKCNIFVNNIIMEGGAHAPVNPTNNRPVMARRWADTTLRNLQGWVIVKGGYEAAQAGDVIAYRNPNYQSASGHVGIVVVGGPNGESVSAASGGPVIIDDFGFDGRDFEEGRRGYVFRRWSRQ